MINGGEPPPEREETDQERVARLRRTAAAILDRLVRHERAVAERLKRERAQ
jgi:hypothetical protein